MFSLFTYYKQNINWGNKVHVTTYVTSWQFAFPCLIFNTCILIFKKIIFILPRGFQAAMSNSTEKWWSRPTCNSLTTKKLWCFSPVKPVPACTCMNGIWDDKPTAIIHVASRFDRGLQRSVNTAGPSCQTSQPYSCIAPHPSDNPWQHCLFVYVLTDSVLNSFLTPPGHTNT